MTKPARADRLFLIYVALLVGLGLVALMSASAPMGYAKFNDTYFFVKRQLLFGVFPGLLAFIILAKLKYQRFAAWSGLGYAMSLILLGLVHVPHIGAVINGSRSWLHVFGYYVQPSEFAKLALIVVLARLLTKEQHNWDDWQHSLLPILAIIAPAVLLILLQPDVGTVSIIVTVIFVMLYLAHVSTKYLVMLGALGVLAFVALVIAAPYRAQRLTTFLHPELDPKGVGYQINQAFLAVGSGGLWGLGLGHSRQKFQYLPEVNADSIYAIIAEEGGFFVATGFVLLFLLIGWRGLQIAKHAPDEFGMLVVAGIMAWILTQSFLNIGAMVGALPLTGVPLPFVSHGGSAMLTVLAAMGVVASVSREVRGS